MTSRKLFSLLLTVQLVNLSGSFVLADEGMWPFNNVPRSAIRKAYGFDVSDDWLRKVQLGSVRFNNGGSGAFVSDEGLVLTNHHIALHTLQRSTSDAKDYVRDGFYAPARSQEAKASGLEIKVLVSIEPVTDRVNSGVRPEMSPADARVARRDAIRAIEKESTESTGLTSSVIMLYQGGRYDLYRYKRYTDVRLVFAPEFKAAFFGGDPDNFTFPRFDLDIAIFRVYENDKPIHSDNYFRWSKTGATDGELVFVSGHPGSTGRLMTVAHLEYLRDAGLPYTLRLFEHRLATFKKYSVLGQEQAQHAREAIFQIENNLKSARGQYDGLRNQSLMATKRRIEDRWRRAVAADPRMREEYGNAWDNVARRCENQRTFMRRYLLIEARDGFDCELFDIARLLVRLAAERSKPNPERLPEFSNAAGSSLERRLYGTDSTPPDLAQMQLTSSLEFMSEELGRDDPLVRTTLAGKAPAVRAAELIKGTRLADIDYRKQLAEGGSKAIEDSGDLMIRLALSIDAEAGSLRKRFESEVLAAEPADYEKIARAQFDIEGTTSYPDATFTLRLSYGAVKGYREGANHIAPFTTMAGLYERAAQHVNREPYELPENWLNAKAGLDLRTPFNFVSTNDITRGNSGSPVFNKNAELVGVIFDGNAQSIAGTFFFDDAQNRAISVDVRAITEALRKIYRSGELLAELMK